MQKSIPTKTEHDETALDGYPELLATLLRARGIATVSEAEAFLHPDYERDLNDPFLLPDMERAVERIHAAIRANERIAVYSDFDCDGIPGAVVLHDYFAKIGYEHVEFYIPHRNREGFGFHTAAVEVLAEHGVGLIITVDCGISGTRACARARELNIDVIITDHHLPEGALPEPYALVNPNAPTSIYPNKSLCGAGVAFQLVRALIARGEQVVVEGWEKWLLDMVGMATIADMVSLREPENRALATYGLMVMQKSHRPGLQQLFRKTRTDQRTVTEDDIGFVLAPRINAASRMDAPEDAFRLLATNDPAEAATLVDHLEKLNRKRKTRVALIVKDAKSRVASSDELRSAIVLGNPDWQPSLLGLAANSLAEEFRRPVFLWGRDEMRVLKGSCRSEGTTNVVVAMRAASHALNEYGGHAFSGGFSVTLEQVSILEDALCEACTSAKLEADAAREEMLDDADIDAPLVTDVLPAPSVITTQTFELVQKIAPYGVGNPKPLFQLDATIRSNESFGKGELHRKITLNEYKLPVIAFFSAKFDGLHELAAGDAFSYPVALESSSFGGRRELRLRVV